MSAQADHPDLARYNRQMLFPPIGVDGQRRLGRASVTLVGCGALGSVLANMLVRAGVGSLRIIDRDFIETSNLQRQMLFDEHDIAQSLPKAEAAVRKLRKINSAVETEAVVADVNPGTIAHLCGDADLLLDGTDNLETRYLLNDLAVKQGIPWVFGACLGSEGLVLSIRPRQTPCLRCVWDEPPPPGVLPTCDTVGVLAPIVTIVASLQAVEALKIITSTEFGLVGRLIAVDAWTAQVRHMNVQAAYDEGQCSCCRQGRYEYLEGGKVAQTTTLCGQDSVQILPPTATPVSFRAIAERLPARSGAKHNEFMLRFKTDECQVTLFADGRAIVQGTHDPAVARAVLAKYVGT